MTLNNHLHSLQQKHDNLKATIKSALSNFQNDTQIQSLKKQKLILKDKIQQLQILNEV